MPPPLASCLFEFEPAVSMGEAAATFALATLAAESLHGADQVALNAIYRVDRANRTIEVDRSTAVGCTLALVFLGYARREFGVDSFKMRRMHVAMAAGDGGER